MAIHTRVSIHTRLHPYVHTLEPSPVHKDGITMTLGERKREGRNCQEKRMREKKKKKSRGVPRPIVPPSLHPVSQVRLVASEAPEGPWVRSLTCGSGLLDRMDTPRWWKVCPKMSASERLDGANDRPQTHTTCVFVDAHTCHPAPHRPT